jgi:heat shock protein HslJ
LQKFDSQKGKAFSMLHRMVLFMWILFLAVACSQTSRLQMNVEEFRSTDWVLEEIDGTAVVDQVRATIRFQGNDRIAGWGGCNRYFANFRSGRTFFNVGPIGSTRRICPPVVMAQEDRFFNALQKARSIQMEDNRLVIDSDAIQKPLKFGRLKKTGG